MKKVRKEKKAPPQKERGRNQRREESKNRVKYPAIKREKKKYMASRK